MKSYVLSFKSDKERNAFYDIGLKKKSVLSLVEVCEGEEQTVKEKRKQKQKKTEKTEKTENDDEYIIFC